MTEFLWMRDTIFTTYLRYKKINLKSIYKKVAHHAYKYAWMKISAKNTSIHTNSNVFSEKRPTQLHNDHKTSDDLPVNENA